MHAGVFNRDVVRLCAAQMLTAAAELERQSAELRSSGLSTFHQLATTMQHRAQQLHAHAELLLGALEGSGSGSAAAVSLLQELEQKAPGLPRDAAA